MKTNIKALELIEKGLSAKTVAKLDESQINVLHSKLNLNEAITQSQTTSFNIPTTDAQKGVTLPSTAIQPGKKATIQQTQKGITITPTEEVSEDVEVDKDNASSGEYTQDMPQKSSPDGMDDDLDNPNEKNAVGTVESVEESKKDGPNPWAICHSQVGPKKSRKWERCVRAVKKQLGEGKNPVSLFLENEIMKIVEKNLPPRITKGDLVKYLSEQGPATAPTKPSPGTKPGVKPGKPDTRPRPSHPGKNPNPGEKESPKAKKVSPEKAKEEVIDLIINLLQK